MKKILFTTALLLMTLGLLADFTEDFQNAQKQFNQRKWADAAVSFAKIAEDASGNRKDKCYSYAARALAQTRKQADAESAVGKIKDPSWKNYTLMAVYSTFGKNSEIIQKFQAEKIDAWPEDIAYLGFYMRGNAMASSKDLAKQAVGDLEKAIAQTGSDEQTKILALHALIRASRTAGDEAKALDAADKALMMKNFKGFYAYLDSAMQKTRILISQKKFDEAKKTLDSLNAERKWNGGAWHFLYLENCGDLALAKGNTAEAKKFYGQAMEIKNVHPGLISNLKTKQNRIQ